MIVIPTPDFYRPTHFIDEPIQVQFDKPPVYTKRPECPDGFEWRGESYDIIAVLKEWRDYQRRGRNAHNMRPSHAATANRRGSWGVGRTYFRVHTHVGRIFDLYYDRAPQSVEAREGLWILYRELEAAPPLS